MKRVTALFLCLTLLLFMPSVHAEGGVSFVMSDAEIQENRLFELAVSAQSDRPLSAALFTFSYDRTLAEFRGVTAKKPFKTAFYDDGNEVRVIFLSADGAASDGTTDLFSLKFKSLSSGSFSADYTVSECVDNHAAYMPIGTCTSGSVTITGKTAAVRSGGSKSASGSSKNSNTGAGSRKSTPKPTSSAEKTGEEPTLQLLGTLSEISLRDSIMPIERVAQIFALCGAVVIMALIGLLLWRGKRSVKTPKK